MSLFKPKNCNKWYIETRIHDGTVKKFSGFPDKSATKELQRNIRRLVIFKKSPKTLPDDDMIKWLELISVNNKKLEKRLAQVGLLEESRVEASKPIMEHVKDFEEMMYRSCNKQYASQTLTQIKKIVKACKFSYWSDVKASEIEKYLHNKKDISAQTEKYYAMAFKHFSFWMVENKRANEPIKFHRIKTTKNRRGHFEPDEFEKILRAAIAGPERFGLSGYQRYLLYQVALQTAMRLAEIYSLTVASFNPNKRTLFVKGEEHTKHVEGIERKVRLSLAAELTDYVKNKMPGNKLFPVNRQGYISKMFKKDRIAAGVALCNYRGEERSFHSIRHTSASILINQGENPKTIQEKMGHKDIKMTFDQYGHMFKAREEDAVNKIPDFTIKRATGTE